MDTSEVARDTTPGRPAGPGPPQPFRPSLACSHSSNVIPTMPTRGDRRPRGVCELLRLQGVLHFQLRISGMSSPCLSMYCLCSISLSLSCCFR